MRSGPCLRIPSMEELSPSSRILKTPTSASSLSKPASPIPSLVKMHHRTITHTSAYTRIVSNDSLKKQTFPSFLCQNPEVLKNIPISATKGQTTDITTDTSSIKAEETKLKTQPAKDLEKFIKQIFSKKLPKNEVLLKVGKFELTRFELQSFDPKQELSQMSIDACLRCIKHRNHKLFTKSDIHSRVLIYETRFAQSLLGSSAIPASSQKSPLKYEFIIFPLFINFWTLLYIDTKLKKLVVYNLDEETSQHLFERVKKYLKNQLKLEKKSIRFTSWQEFSLHLIQTPKPLPQDSSVLTIQLAYQLSLSPSQNSLKSSDFRYNLLVMLCKHGLDTSLM